MKATTLQQSKNWCFTLNNPTLPYPTLNVNMRYLAYGVETGEQGTCHLQGFVVFKSNAALSKCKKAKGLERCHWEMMKGRIDQNEKYCSKESKLYEFGDRPANRKQQADDQREKWTEMHRLACHEGYEACLAYDPHWTVNNQQKIKNWARWARGKRVLPVLDDFSNIWLTGPSGVGKTYTARSLAPAAYIKMPNKWWDNYDGQDDVIIEDVHPDWVGMHQLKTWADLYPCRVEVKGGSMMIRPKRTIVTSNYTIEECMKNQVDVEPMRRRFKTVNKHSRDDDTTLGLGDLEPVYKKQKISKLTANSSFRGGRLVIESSDDEDYKIASPDQL